VKLSGQLFYNALIWGAPATLINFVLMGWFLGQAQGRNVLLLSVIGNGTNIILDYLLIVKWGWESTGAGTATAVSQYVMLMVGLSIAGYELRTFKSQDQQQHQQLFSPQLRDRLFQISALKEALFLNGDIVIRTLALISTFAIFTNLSSTLGTVVLAGNTLLLQVVTLAAYFVDGFAFATESYAGQLYGANQRDRLPALIQISGGLSLGCGLAIALLTALMPTPLFKLLTDHLEVVESAKNYVWWLWPILGFGSIAYMLDGYFLGLTAGRILRQSTVIAALLGFMPLLLIAWQFQNNHLLWLALTGFMLARAVTLSLKVTRTYKY